MHSGLATICVKHLSWAAPKPHPSNASALGAPAEPIGRAPWRNRSSPARLCPLPKTEVFGSGHNRADDDRFRQGARPIGSAGAPSADTLEGGGFGAAQHKCMRRIVV